MAAALGIHRDTVARHLRQAKRGTPIGSEPPPTGQATSDSEAGKLGQGAHRLGGHAGHAG